MNIVECVYLFLIIWFITIAINASYNVGYNMNELEKEISKIKIRIKE